MCGVFQCSSENIRTTSNEKTINWDNSILILSQNGIKSQNMLDINHLQAAPAHREFSLIRVLGFCFER